MNIYQTLKQKLEGIDLDPYINSIKERGRRFYSHASSGAKQWKRRKSENLDHGVAGINFREFLKNPLPWQAAAFITSGFTDLTAYHEGQGLEGLVNSLSPGVENTSSLENYWEGLKGPLQGAVQSVGTYVTGFTLALDSLRKLLVPKIFKQIENEEEQKKYAIFLDIGVRGGKWIAHGINFFNGGILPYYGKGVETLLQIPGTIGNAIGSAFLLKSTYEERRLRKGMEELARAIAEREKLKKKIVQEGMEQFFVDYMGAKMAREQRGTQDDDPRNEQRRARPIDVDFEVTDTDEPTL